MPAFGSGKLVNWRLVRKVHHHCVSNFVVIDHGAVDGWPN